MKHLDQKSIRSYLLSWVRMDYFLLISSLLPIILAYIAQHGFHLEPCKLCLYQRVPFFLLLSLSIALFLLKQRGVSRVIFFVSLFLFIANGSLSFYHAGVEYRLFDNVFVCTDEHSMTATSIEEARELLMGKKAKLALPSCEIAPFRFLGLSFAGWGFIYCLGCAILLILIERLERKNREGIQ